MSRSGAARVLVALVLLLCGATESTASTSVGRAIPIRVASPVPSALSRALKATLPYHRILGSVAIDLNGDGYLDVVASTADTLVVVWLNDGFGRLVHGLPARASWLRDLAAQLQPQLDDAVSEDQPGGAKPRHDVSVAGSSTDLESSTVRIEARDAGRLLRPVRDRRASRGPPALSGV